MTTAIKPRFNYFGRRIHKNSILYILSFWCWFYKIDQTGILENLYLLRHKLNRIWTTHSLTKEERDIVKLLVEAYAVERGD